MITNNVSEELLNLINFLIKNDLEGDIFSHCLFNFLHLITEEKEKQSQIFLMKKRYFPIYLKSGSSMVERYLSIIKNGNFIIFSFWKKNEVNMSFLYFISDYLKKVD